MTNNNHSSKVGRAVAWSSAAEFLSKLITPIVNMVLARLLTPDAFGIVATITMVISFAEVFTDAGFQKYIIQKEFADDDALDRSTNVAFWTNFLMSLLACVIIFVFRHDLARLVGSEGLGNSLSISSLMIILVSFSSIQMARYKRDFDFKTLFVVRIGGTLIPLLVTLPAAIILKNYWAIIIGNIAVHIFNAIILTVKSKWKPKFEYSFALFKQMFSFSAWTLVESISIWLTSYIDIFIVGSYLSDFYLGLYKTSMTTVNSYMGIITAAVTPVLFSALSRSQNNEDEFKDTYYRFQRMTAVFVFPMGIGMLLFSELVTLILLGNQWMEAAPFVGLWALTSAVTIIFSHFSSEVYRSKGKPKISFATQLIHLCILIPVLVFSIKYGFEILYIARALVRFTLVATALIFMHFMYKFYIHKVFINVIPSLFSSIVMGVTGYFLKQINTAIWWQFAVIFICIMVYFTVLLTLFPKFRRELLQTPLVNKILSRLHIKIVNSQNEKQ
ncbi:MAG: lipopolysaccharide biosynthesis protein [Clostridia bacterium]|nr:lipopolysaccharide biosynthesis protein [Clostridia bacterium]